MFAATGNGVPRDAALLVVDTDLEALGKGALGDGRVAGGANGAVHGVDALTGVGRVLKGRRVPNVNATPWFKGWMRRTWQYCWPIELRWNVQRTTPTVASSHGSTQLYRHCGDKQGVGMPRHASKRARDADLRALLEHARAVARVHLGIAQLLAPVGAAVCLACAE